MTTNDESFVSGALIGAFIMLLCCAAVGIFGIPSCVTRAVRMEAAKEGAGQWVIDPQTGEQSWKWNARKAEQQEP